MLLSGLSVAREREQGTFDQLMVTPLTSTEILAGKAVPPLVIGLMQSCIVLVFAVFWFHVHVIGNLITLFIVMFIFLLSCVGLGLAISANSKNMQQVMVYNFVVLRYCSILRISIPCVLPSMLCGVSILKAHLWQRSLRIYCRW